MIPLQNSNSSISSNTPEFHSKLFEKLRQFQFQSNWVPTDSPVITNPHIIDIIKQFRNTHKRKDLSGYGNLAIRQAMRYQQLNVTYEGTWKNNIPQGYGIFYYDSGIYYEGYIKNAELQGYGLLIMDNQQCFYGEFKKNRPQGNVTFQGYDIKAKGIFEKGQELIQGEIVSYKQHTKIVMQSKDFGSIEYKNGMSYQGYIKNREPCGKGKLMLPNGDTQQGEIFDGKFNGQCVYTWKEGFKFQGGYENNSRQGLGKFYHTPDLFQECYWEKGVKSGNIKIFFKNTLVFTGIDLVKIKQIINKYTNK